MRFEQQHFDGSFFDRQNEKFDKVQIPVECLNCVQKIAQLPNTHGNIQVKKSVKLNLKSAWGANKYHHVLNAYGIRL